MESECWGGHFWSAELALGDEPNAELRLPMPTLLWLVLVQVYIRNRLVLHLCRLLVEPLMAVGLCPMHCPLNLFIFKHKHVFNSPRGVQQKFPNRCYSSYWSKRRDPFLFPLFCKEAWILSPSIQEETFIEQLLIFFVYLYINHTPDKRRRTSVTGQQNSRLISLDTSWKSPPCT